ncbi:hypothetical protein [uncultured Fusobacterium sp.]|nr:hypothetical protein [uncultured Fusobacterium sp.]
MIKSNIYFADVFNVEEKKLQKYGAMNISIINDLPLFIDPFLLFNSEKKEYQKLHEKILEYLGFLRDEANLSNSNFIPNGKLKAWYTFSEVKQNWLGFTLKGNSGRGLGNDFAIELYQNLNNIFNNFGNEQITESAHLEKLCIIGNKVGRDKVSDFTTNLIKDYLLTYTENFAKKFISNIYCKTIQVPKAFFNYKTKSWATKNYYLPFWENDYVILTPRDLLTRDDTFISKYDMSQHYENIIPSIEDETLRFNLNNYITQKLYDPNRKKGKKPTKKEREEAFLSTIKVYPEIIDYYIKYKEENKEKATKNSKLVVQETNSLFNEKLTVLINLLENETEFYKKNKNSYEEAMERVQFLKNIIEDKDGYKIFYLNGKPIKRENDLQIMFKLVWCATPYNVDSEVNNGRGPVDFKVSKGSKDSTLIEFKLASNSKLKQNLAKQVEIYQKANNNTQNTIKVILFFNEVEAKKINKVISELKIDMNNIVIIDAQNNKLSASNETIKK